MMCAVAGYSGTPLAKKLGIESSLPCPISRKTPFAKIIQRGGT